MAGYEGARLLIDDALNEFVHLSHLISGELVERCILNREISEDVKENLGCAVGEVMRPLMRIVGRVGATEKDTAKIETQRLEVERRKKLMLERTQKISAA